MGVGEPARALVVEIGQRALLELDRRLDGLRHDAVGIAARRFARRRGRRHFGHDVDEIGRIEPGAPQVVELLRRCGDADARADRRRSPRRECWASGPRGRGRSRRWWSGCSVDRCRLRAMCQSQRPASWKRECKMPKNVSSSRAMAITGDRAECTCVKPDEHPMLRDTRRSRDVSRQVLPIDAAHIAGTRLNVTPPVIRDRSLAVNFARVTGFTCSRAYVRMALCKARLRAHSCRSRNR